MQLRQYQEDCLDAIVENIKQASAISSCLSNRAGQDRGIQQPSCATEQGEDAGNCSSQ